QQFFNLFNQWNDVINVEWQGITSKGFNFLKSAVYDYDLGNSNNTDLSIISSANDPLIPGNLVDDDQDYQSSLETMGVFDFADHIEDLRNTFATSISQQLFSGNDFKVNDWQNITLEQFDSIQSISYDYEIGDSNDWNWPMSLLLSASRTANIIVNYDSSYDQHPLAKRAFEYAANIWERLIDSDVPITIDATFKAASNPNNLGSCGTYNWVKFSNSPWYYDVSLANSLAGRDINPYASDMFSNLNSNRKDWYFGLDGNTPTNYIDFVEIALHEICHGLGISGFKGYQASTGRGYYWDGDYTSYDQFVGNGDGKRMTEFPNYSLSLGQQFTSNNLYWFGQNAIDANGGYAPKLYAPSRWIGGSSYSHLDENTYPRGTSNALMTPYGPNGKPGQALHHPGAIILGMLEDIGWKIPYDTHGDTLKKAFVTSHNGSTKLTHYSAAIGDGVYFDRDVDIYKFYLNENSDRLIINVKAQAMGSGLDSFLSLADSQGNLIAYDDNSGYGSDSYLYWHPAQSGLGAGWYYVAISGKGNLYDPNRPYSGTGGSTGSYQLTLDTIDAPDPAQYAASYPDLIVNIGWNPNVLIDHYVFSGRHEGRSRDNFDERCYVASCDDLIPVFGCHNLNGATVHYIQAGYGEGRNPLFFDAYQYLASYDDLIGALGDDQKSATEHFIMAGYYEGRSRDNFDELRYVASYDDLVGAFGCNNPELATRHYVESGCGEGRNARLFNAYQYLASHDDLIWAFGNNGHAATEHFIDTGCSENRGRDLFPEDIYIASHGDLIQAFGYNLEAGTQHYINSGVHEGREKALFDPVAYLNNYGDLQAAFGNDLVGATQHYIVSGFAEGRTWM
ncbi:MAG: hypothetical protein AB4063_11600, partial [Crocosphaera sp.]